MLFHLKETHFQLNNILIASISLLGNNLLNLITPWGIGRNMMLTRDVPCHSEAVFFLLLPSHPVPLPFTSPGLPGMPPAFLTKGLFVWPRSHCRGNHMVMHTICVSGELGDVGIQFLVVSSCLEVAPVSGFRVWMGPDEDGTVTAFSPPSAASAGPTCCSQSQAGLQPPPRLEPRPLGTRVVSLEQDPSRRTLYSPAYSGPA